MNARSSPGRESDGRYEKILDKSSFGRRRIGGVEWVVVEEVLVSASAMLRYSARAG